MVNKVAILLTTWNSGRYLVEQLDSILNQTYKNWELYIRDDCSTDDTPHLLAVYEKKDNRVHVLPDTRKRGAKDGFMWLLEQVEADFYMFCDHDDVWLSTKIENSLQCILSQADIDTTPLIVGTDMCVVDAELRLIAASYWKRQHYALSLCHNKWFHLVYNNVAGCTMLFNRTARDLALPCPSEAQLHDSWLACSVLWKGGRILPLEQPSLLYRQHQKNAVGAHRVPSYFSQLRKIKTLWRKTHREWKAVSGIADVGFVYFLMVKLYYMVILHWHDFKNNVHR